MLTSAEIDAILDDVPDYRAFLTVDELRASSQALADRYASVQHFVAGYSRAGDPIDALQIGSGPRQALLFALPHPNEPIGAMTLEYFAARLAADDGLRERLGYTWTIIKCIDPDGTRLNEGWFKGPFDVGTYARHYYRPAASRQVEWTFPVSYKTLQFDTPLPETRALMGLIEAAPPDFLYSLHNAGFGGVFYYLSEAAGPLHEPFYALARSQGLPLHLGEPEVPFVEVFNQAIFRVPLLADLYDFFAAAGADPAVAISGGTASFDYAGRFGSPFSLVCEMPYFYHDAIGDTTPTEMSRRDALLVALGRNETESHFINEALAALGQDLAENPFYQALAEMQTQRGPQLTARRHWATSAPETAQPATVAERFDNLVLSRFYDLLALGMLNRLLVASSDDVLRVAARERFVHNLAALESDLGTYQVIPIQKLVRVQLGSALHAAGYAARRATAQGAV